MYHAVLAASYRDDYPSPSMGLTKALTQGQCEESLSLCL